MPELKTYSVLIRWNDDDEEEGEYGAIVRAPNRDEAEAMTRAMMRAAGKGSYPFGSLIECTEGAMWAADDLEKALRPIIWQLERMDGLPEEVEAMIAAGKAALARCEPDGQAWGALHYDNRSGNEPDWSTFTSLEIDGCALDESDPDEASTDYGKTDDEAEFWTIYGRDKEGLAMALQDCVSRAEADHVLAEMMRASGLPGYRVGEEMPEAIKGVPFPHDRDDCDGEHSAALIEDDMATWQYEVANGDTRLGYDEWIAARKEAA